MKDRRYSEMFRDGKDEGLWDTTVWEWNGTEYVEVADTEDATKARERRFGSRSEAGRYAANVRWGTITGMSAEEADALFARSQSQISASATAEANSVMSQLGEVTDEELTVVFGYSSGGYMRVNGALRGQDMSADDAERGRAEAEVLQGLMDRAPALQRDLALFRGIRASERNAEAVAKIANAPVGSVIKDPAFLSTSHGKDTAAMFSGGVDLRIVVPKGSKALPLHVIGSLAQGEREWLLPRNTRLRVVKREIVDEPNATMRYPSNMGTVRLTVVVEAD